MPIIIGLSVFALVLLLGRKRRVKVDRFAKDLADVRGLLARHLDERGYPRD